MIKNTEKSESIYKFMFFQREHVFNSESKIIAPFINNSKMNIIAIVCNHFPFTFQRFTAIA